jgi:hypothetical protein
MSDTHVVDEEWPNEQQELPRRPRQRLLAPLPASLLAVLLVACGFLAGVLVQKGQQGTGAQGTGALGGGARFGGGGGGGRFTAGGAGVVGAGLGGGRSQAGGGLAGATVGEVAYIERGNLFVTDTQGNTVEVKVPAGLKVAKTVSVPARQVHPGETVVVQGERAGNGSVRARSIALGGGGALFAAATGGGAAAGGTTALFGSPSR